jgi:hypothetical protein
VATPSVKTIIRTFSKLSRAEARELREVMLNARGDQGAQDALHEANRILDGHGVEVVAGPHFRRGFWADAVLAYVNMGDTYKATIGFEPDAGYTGRFVILPGGWGSWLEWYEQKHGVIL